MPIQKVTFPNATGETLSARLSLPVDQDPYAYALFAHCFTCSSSLRAVREISQALNLAGIGVLRFDFTGLGASEGDFSATNFSSNISDLLSAADWLAEHHQAPSLLVGHSLGGAAVVCAAHQLESVKAVATVGAPFDPAHVSHLLGEDGNAQILKEGHATVDIGGRPFTIRKQFLDDLGNYGAEAHMAHLGRALLILHSPQDRTVNIDEAAKVYHAAKHPKSFVSLDGADHLLSDPADSHYAGQVIAGWSSRYLPRPEAKGENLKPRQVAARLGDTGYTTEIMVRHHSLTADEPESVGGSDYGPSPYELLSAGLSACTVMTIQMYARRKKWPVEEVICQVDHRKDYATDMAESETKPTKVDHFDRKLELKGPLTDEQKQRLLEIADRCPVHRTMHEEVVIQTELLA
ncbi:MAG: bifunctional alpha/beta hydrolase/OsmC family protein [Bacteroidota bacterium]